MHNGDSQTPGAPREMSFWDHLEELRWRIIWSLIGVAVTSSVGLWFSDELLNWVTAPVGNLHPAPKIITLAPASLFMAKIYIGLGGGVVLASPWILWQLWMFIAPAVGKRTRIMVPLFVALTLLFFLGGVLFGYYIVLPQGLAFLVQVGATHVEPTMELGNIIDFVVELLLGFGLVFELPVFTAILSRVGILSPRFMLFHWRIVVVVIFVISAVLTPPDVVSQCLMAGPLMLLYLFSVGVSWALYRERSF